MGDQSPTFNDPPYPSSEHEGSSGYGQSGYTQPQSGVPIQPLYPPPPPTQYSSMGVYPAYAMPVVASEPGRGLALAGLVLALASVLAFIATFLSTDSGDIFYVFLFGGLFSSIVGIILSALGRRSQSRRTMAIVGLVLSIVVLALIVLITVVGILVFANNPNGF